MPRDRKNNYGRDRRRARIGNANRRCILGNISSIDNTKRPQQVEGQPHIPSKVYCNTRGMKCERCGKFSCYNCLRSLYEIFLPKFREIDNWCRVVGDIFENELDHGPSGTFVGSCCEYKDEYVQTKKENPMVNQNIRGDVIAPEYLALFPSPFGVVDVHVFGPCKISGVKGVIHANVDREYPGVRPKPLKPEIQEFDIDVTVLPTISEFLPNWMIFGKGNLKVVIAMLSKQIVFEDSRKGEYPSQGELAGCSKIVFEDISTDADVILVCGRSEKEDFNHLLCGRYSHVPEVKNLKGLHLKQFIQATDKSLPAGGVSSKRKGGSNGKVVFNDDMKRFMKYKGNFPRRGYGVKLIKNNLHWDALYMSPLTGRPVLCSVYAQPRPGGSLNLPKQIFSQYPAIREYASRKIGMAQLLDYFNTRHSFNIQPPAVRAQMEEVRAAYEANRSRGCFDLNSLIETLTQSWRFTKNCYPVAYHEDNFSKCGVSRIEAKTCFVDNSRDVSNGVGRGGCGNKYVFSFLGF